MWKLFYIILLPMICSPFHVMRDQQRIDIVWVNTSREYWAGDIETGWNDQRESKQTIDAALDWWEQKVNVDFQTYEYTITVDLDILAENVCRNRIPMPPVNVPTLYMIAYYPTYRMLNCDGTPVGDYGVGQYMLTSGFLVHDSPADQATIAHTLAHAFGAPDGHYDPRTYDIMDRDYYIEAYKQGFISDRIITALGAERK